jgi:hypothetical protein
LGENQPVEQGAPMSRGPGKLQQCILAALEAHPEHRLPRSELRQRFPDVNHANHRRVIRSLARVGRVYEHAENVLIGPNAYSEDLGKKIDAALYRDSGRNPRERGTG